MGYIHRFNSLLRVLSLVMAICASIPTHAQRLAPSELTIEASTTASSGDAAPLWLVSNRHGLSSLKEWSGYQRATLLRSAQLDSTRKWRVGYGLDLAVGEAHERTMIVQQAYAEVAWKILKLRLGSKQEPLVTKNDHLSSGDLSLGINARPIPQLRLDVDWFSIPFTHDWWQWRFYGSFGTTTDGAWQKDFVNTAKDRYTSDVLYHEKALYWKVGNLKKFPFTYQLALRMGSTFGGTSYNIGGKNQVYDHPVNLRAFWSVLTCSGNDETDGNNPNTAGNHVGSYVMQLKYHGQRWQARAYWERMFEDQSMLTVQYGIRDMLIGGEVNLPANRWLSTVVLEYITSTDQSGAVYHDYAPTIPDKMNGRDNYYNHHLYSGWQHYGQNIGNPLLTSPVYNFTYVENNYGGRAKGPLYCFNNRLKALHVGLSGDPTPEWHWRAMASMTKNFGTYFEPLVDATRQAYLFAEASYRPRWASGWQGILGVAIDHGHLIGNSTGLQFTLRKRLSL